MESASYRAAPAPVAAAARSALLLGYSAPMPGVGSRYSDGAVAHETRLLGAAPLADALSVAGGRSVAEAVLEASWVRAPSRDARTCEPPVT
jgi:hypothetical protein